MEVSEADIKRGLEFAQPLHRAWIKKNANGQAIYDAYLKIISDYRAGS